MQQILTDEAVILYDAIQTMFDVLFVGGSESQQKEIMTGEYEPDRTETPLELVPTLKVTDGNRGETDVEKISSCTVNWYKIAGDGSETPITLQDTDYELDGKNLIVNANIDAGQTQNLIVRVSYPDSYTGTNLSFEKKISLSTTAKKSFDPMLYLDVPNLVTVNPFFTNDGDTRVVTASFFAGSQDISTNSRVAYKWEKLDGGTYRDITANDLDVASISTRSVVIDGQSVTRQYRTMTLRMDCIGQCKYRCTAYHMDIADSQFRQSVVFTVDRKMYGERKEIRVTKGKYLKGETKDSTAEFIVHVNSNLLANPEDYYRVEWAFYRLSGSQKQDETSLGWGMSATVDRSKSGTDKTKKPTFSATPHSLSEYQMLTYNDEVVIDDSGSQTASSYGGNVVGQVMQD